MMQQFPCNQSRTTRVLQSGLAIAAIAGAFSARHAGALDVPLNNPSFELPPITPNPGSQNPADFVLPFIDGWDETGPITSQQGFEGMLDTGVFINTPVDLGGGVVLPPIANADGAQLAFMLVNPAADGVTEPVVSISQESAALFQAERTYAFSIGIGPGVLFPPTTDDPANNPATLVLSLGYDDPGGTGFVSVVDQTVDSADLLPDGTLTFFSVGVGSPLAPGSAAVGNEVVVRVSQAGGTGGGFNLDIARLTFLAGDTDGDGDIDDFDLLDAIANFTGSLEPVTGGKTPAQGDTDEDQDVDDFDLIEMIATYTGSADAPEAPPVPEPGTVALLGLGGLALTRRRR